MSVATAVAASPDRARPVAGGTPSKANQRLGRRRVASVGGNVDAHTGSGNVSVKGAKKAASLSSGSGNIVAILTGEGDVKASTGSGDITLTGVVGLLSASTGSGSIGVEGKPTGDWKLSAASGDVTVAVPAAQGYTLDASTTSGNLAVASGIDVQRQPGRRRAQGAVNGGGPTVRLSTASGDIAVRLAGNFRIAGVRISLHRQQLEQWRWSEILNRLPGAGAGRSGRT